MQLCPDPGCTCLLPSLFAPGHGRGPGASWVWKGGRLGFGLGGVSGALPRSGAPEPGSSLSPQLTRSLRTAGRAPALGSPAVHELP